MAAGGQVRSVALDAGEKPCDKNNEDCIARCPKGDKNCMNTCNQAYGKCLKDCKK